MSYTGAELSLVGAMQIAEGNSSMICVQLDANQPTTERDILISFSIMLISNFTSESMNDVYLPIITQLLLVILQITVTLLLGVHFQQVFLRV